MVIENKFMVTRGWGGINWEIGIDIYTLLYIKYITNKNLLYSTGNCTQYCVITYNGRECKKKCLQNSLTVPIKEVYVPSS